MEEQTAKLESHSNVPTYGPIGAGEYFTPYQTTVVYHTRSIFETAVAFLSRRAQIIPLDENVDYGSVAASCEHPSPDIILFGNEFSHENLNKFFDRGFQLIHIFTYENDRVQKMDDPRIVTFDINTIYDHIVLLDGFTSSFLFEHILSGTFPNHNDFISHEAGVHFLIALRTEKAPIGDTLLKLCSSYRGYENACAMVVKGKTIQEMRERGANKCIGDGIFFDLKTPTGLYTTLAISSEEYVGDIIALAPVNPKVIDTNTALIMIYSFEPHIHDATTYPGWRVILVGAKNAPSAVETLKIFSCDLTVGEYGVASTWIPTGAAHGLLPFIYPTPSAAN